MGVNLWGESSLYMNPVPSFYDGNESTSRRQGPSPSYGVSRGHHREVVGSGRQGLNLTGESPVVPIARFRVRSDTTVHDG